MAQVEITFKTTIRWWVTPLVNCYAISLWLFGKDQFAPGFVEWIATHGVKIEVMQ